ncbi:MAG: prepilin-type N-terminal cleavage/methylation domain-containing protein [Pelagibacterales bacterium]|nr:prepilin-type N-terminal cleavage/methylation domain-containing protein [Pelagibacterales bacterium]
MIKKKLIRAFTLIELLVVVAIIGILAAVGVVAYQGYTSGAQENAVKTNHSQVLKYIAAESQKCNISSTGIAFGVNNFCATPITAARVIAQLPTALVAFKNPYNASAQAFSQAGGMNAANIGYIYVAATPGVANSLTINSCYGDCTAAQQLSVPVSIR